MHFDRTNDEFSRYDNRVPAEHKLTVAYPREIDAVNAGKHPPAHRVILGTESMNDLG